MFGGCRFYEKLFKLSYRDHTIYPLKQILHDPILIH